MYDTIIQNLGNYCSNSLYIKREDLIPYSFGGNKARKAFLFFDEMDKGNCDCVVTYGSSHSNHCRIIANMALKRKMDCYIISPLEVSDKTFNSVFMELFGAKITCVPVDQVHDTIENTISMLKEKGYNPYFIPGGGHGNIGTQAYVDCFDEIVKFTKKSNVKFDYVFFASGTGTTHAGLVCGKILSDYECKIVGISIARKNPRGKNIVTDSVNDYLASVNVKKHDCNNEILFIDEYVGLGYGKDDVAVIEVIKEVMSIYGIPLDSTYTGKAFYGMKDFLIKNKIENKIKHHSIFFLLN